MLAYKHCVGLANQEGFYDANVAVCETWLTRHTSWGGSERASLPDPSAPPPARVLPPPLLDVTGELLRSPGAE